MIYHLITMVIYRITIVLHGFYTYFRFSCWHIFYDVDFVVNLMCELDHDVSSKLSGLERKRSYGEKILKTCCNKSYQILCHLAVSCYLTVSCYLAVPYAMLLGWQYSMITILSDNSAYFHKLKICLYIAFTKLRN